MKVTRESHLNYMVKMVPLLVIAYAAQAYVYNKYWPGNTTQEIVLSIGIALACLIGLFLVHDHYHEIRLHQRHLEIKFPVLGVHEELLYSHIDDVVVEGSKRSFSDVVLHIDDGRTIRLFHVDNAHVIRKIIFERK